MLRYDEVRWTWDERFTKLSYHCKFKNIDIPTYSIYPFQVNVLLPYPVKTSQNLQMETFFWYGLNQYHRALQSSSLLFRISVTLLGNLLFRRRVTKNWKFCYNWGICIDKTISKPQIFLRDLFTGVTKPLPEFCCICGNLKKNKHVLEHHVDKISSKCIRIIPLGSMDKNHWLRAM